MESRIVLAAPTLAAISDVAFLAGSPIHIPLNGADSDGDPLTFSVSSNNAALTLEVPEGNRSLRITALQGDVMSPTISGEMTFELFEDEASRATNRVITLAESGFYDGSTFHRVVDNFVIQGGDPNGTPPGTGGSALGDFDDQFDVDLQHNRTGLLSYAKSADDTNDSQFFITEFTPSFVFPVDGETSEQKLRRLDSNHTVFGVQTTGESIRAAISDTALTGSAPTVDVVMTSVEIFVDEQNGVLRLNAPEGATSNPDEPIVVTVTVSDGVETAQQSFNVTFTPDGHDNDPFLADIPSIRTLVDTPTTFQLTAIDAESTASTKFLDEESLAFNGRSVPVTANPDEVSYDVGFLTGLVSVRPASSFTGTTPVTVATGEILTAIDYQVVSIEVVAAAAPLTVSSADHPGLTEANDGSADEIRVMRNGTVLEVSVNGQLTAQAEFQSVTTLTIDGSRDDDTLIVDYSGGNPFPSGGIVFSGYTVDPEEMNPPADTGFDTLELTGGNIEETIYSFVNANDGSVNLDARLLTYTGLEPIIDNLNVTDRVFAFSSADDVIVVGDDGTAANGLSRISTSGTGETVDFTTPLGSLTIFGGAGGDTITVGDLDSGAFAATVDGGSGNDSIVGSTLGDLLRGGGGNDTLAGGLGNDRLLGEDDNDSLIGGVGNDVADGGSGNDSIETGAGADRVFGGIGNDTINGGDDADQLFGGNGTDVIDGGDGADLLRGGLGFDNLRGQAGADTLFGDEGNDTLVGGDGDDSLDGGVFDDRIFGDDGNDTISGNNGRDFVRGGNDDDLISGGTGFDTILGDLGNDTISGDNGFDTIYAGSGQDSVSGGDGNDRIFGNNGADTISGGLGDDFLRGSNGLDRIFGDDGNDAIFGDNQNDTIFGGSGDDSIDAGEGADVVFAGVGNDLVDGAAGNDRIFGDAGTDTLSGAAGNDFLRGGTGFDRLEGEAGLDTLTGDQGNDTLFGGDDADTLFGNDGNDRGFGDAGNDLIHGGFKNDSLFGGSGNDTLTGSTGNDFLRGGDDADQIDGGDGADVVMGDGGDDFINGDAGNDTLDGSDGADTLRGGAGNDSLLGGAGNDGLSGAGGEDFLLGDLGDDTIYGGSGNDALLGSGGQDTVVGGGGADTVRGNGATDVLVGGSGTGTADAGDIFPDAESGEIDENFMLMPLPGWVEEV